MNLTDEELLEATLSEQIPEAPKDESNSQIKETPIEKPVDDHDMSQYIGKTLNHLPGENPFKEEKAFLDDAVERRHLSRIGETIQQNADIREGWIDVDPVLLGDRAIFYPEDWRFRIRPATVEAIRNWSTINDEDPNSVDDVFNEVLKACLSIVTPTGVIPWGNVRTWDRFFFLLLIREYTFVEGETAIAWEDDCPECDNPVKFELSSQSLMYDLPDESVMKYYDRANGCWRIDPEDFDLDYNEEIVFWLPTLEKDASIKSYVIRKLQENPKRKLDQTFYKFLQWMSKKINKDEEFQKKQIKELENKYKSWDTETFSFMNDVLRNIVVEAETKLKTTCPICGEEVSSPIRFQFSISSLFNVPNKHRKFGSK